MTLRLLILLALFLFAGTLEGHAQEPPPVISLANDVKPLPWRYQSVVAGRVFAW